MKRLLVAVWMGLPGAAVWAGEVGGPPTVWVNSLGMRFVQVPAGEFQMGHAETAERWQRDYPQYPPERFALLGDEAPVHRVRITRDFWLGQHEVTVGQFRRFLERSG